MTLWGSFRQFGLLAALLVALPVQANTSEGEWLYSVKPGDTLIGVAETYLARTSDWHKLQRLNHIHNPRRLMPGSKLRLPVALLKRVAAVASVIYLQGKVTRISRNGVPQTLTRDAQLEVGDMIETDDDASASLRFVDGSRLLLTPGTRVTLADMLLYGKSGMAQTMLELHRGSLESRVATQQRPAARYEVKSRTLNLAVRGTDFRAAFNEQDHSARGEVIEGTVQVDGTRGSSVTVQAGYGTLAMAEQAPAAPRALPPAPDLSSLPNLVERLPLRFELSAYAGVKRYRAQVFSDRTFEHLLLDGEFTSHTAKWRDLPDGRYVLRVRSMDQDGLEGLNVDHDFVLKARPEPPFIRAPLDGKNAYGPEAKLHWSTSTIAQAYHVQVSTKPDFSDLLADLPGLTQTEHAVPLAPGQYYWRVASVAVGQDQGPFSDAQGFTQRALPESPKMEVPQTDGKHMIFRWSAGEPGSQYQIQLAGDAEFTRPVLDQVLSLNQLQIDRLAPGTYYMRTRTIESDGFAGPYGAAQKLEVPGESRWRWLLLLLIPFAL